MSGVAARPPAATLAVGDPVDVISGVQFDVALDFRIEWTFPFEWRRFYTTARVDQALPLGWGHTHSYDHRLTFDLNGVRYVDPAGRSYTFPFVEKVGGCVKAGAAALRRVAALVYQVKVAGFAGCEFEFTDPARPAHLRRLYRGHESHELRYTSDGRWTDVVFRSEPPVGVEHDAQGRVQTLIWRGARDGRDRVLWEGKYDIAGDLTTVIDPYHTTQSFAYDPAHRMVGRKDRRGYGFVASYDDVGQCDRSAGEDGMQEVRLQYFPAQHLTVVSRADGGAWQYRYQAEGISQVVDPYGGVTERVYGEGGRLEGEIGPEGEVLQRVEDPETGRLGPPFPTASGMSLPLGDPWFGRIREVDLPDDALGWDGYGEARCRNLIRLPRRQDESIRGLPAAVTASLRFAEHPGEGEEEAQPTFLIPGVLPPKKRIGVPDFPGIKRHDPFGLLLSHSLPGGATARWQYDPNGNVTRYSDYAGSDWRYEYASWNLKVAETDPMGNRTTFVYSLVEQPTRVADAGGTTTTRSYDLKDRMVVRERQTEPRDRFGYDRSDGLVAASTGPGQRRVSLVLGSHRRPVEVAPADRSVRHCGYDEDGQLVSVSDDDGPSLEFAYERTGDLALDLQGGQGVRRRYEEDRLIESTVLDRFSTRYLEDATEPRTTLIDPTGARHVLRRLASGLVLRQHPAGVEELAQFDWTGACLAKVRFRRDAPYAAWSRVYRYSPVGALIGVEDSSAGHWTYQYDAAHRLIRAVKADGPTLTFTHDGAGNLLQGPGLVGAIVADNQLIAANGHRFDYTDRQQVQAERADGVEREYRYDAEDRLISCRTGKDEISFQYDALGRRSSKTSEAGSTRFLWDGERLAAEIAPDGALRVYVYADTSARTPIMFVDYDDVEAAPGAGRRRYLFTNQIAAPVRVEDDAGIVLWSAEIDPYGHAVISPDAQIALNLRWPGHYFDEETGLHYNRHRYYSPDLGRYIQVDPRDTEGGLNVYAYPARPLDQVDVDGLAPCKKKPMITPDEDDKAFQAAKKKADKIEKDLRAALEASKMHPMAKAGKTLTTMVVVDKNGKYVVVVTGNCSKRVLPRSVKEATGGAKYIAYGDDAPPPVRQTDDGHRFERDNPRSDDREPTTHKHAEQRGLRATDCDPDTKGVAYVAPTRPCCEGCSSAIQDRGGTTDNVSKHGVGDGTWW